MISSCKEAGCLDETRTNRNEISLGYCAEHWRLQSSRARRSKTFIKSYAGADGHSAYVSQTGYVQLWTPEGIISEHRYVMQKKIGRKLRAGESAHHLNGIRTDNRPDNLELWVKPQPAGQRVADLLDFIARQYPAEVMARINELNDLTALERGSAAGDRRADDSGLVPQNGDRP